MDVIMQIGTDRSCSLHPTTYLFFPVVGTDALVACLGLAISTTNGRKKTRTTWPQGPLVCHQNSVVPMHKQLIRILPDGRWHPLA